MVKTAVTFIGVGVITSQLIPSLSSLSVILVVGAGSIGIHLLSCPVCRKELLAAYRKPFGG